MPVERNLEDYINAFAIDPNASLPQIFWTPDTSEKFVDTSILFSDNKNNVSEKYQIEQWNVKPTKISSSDEVYESPTFGKIYKDSEQTIGNKEIWYSKDNAGHAGSKYKLFVKKRTVFEWIADVDESGKVIKNKHKSDKGKIIPIKKLRKLK